MYLFFMDKISHDTYDPDYGQIQAPGLVHGQHYNTVQQYRLWYQTCIEFCLLDMRDLEQNKVPDLFEFTF